MNDLLKNLNSLLPVYETELPFSKQQVFFNPFKVKDAKSISIIIQEDNKMLVLKTLVDLIKNCCKDIDATELCLADAEYLFLMIRSKSVEENINLIVKGQPVRVNIFDIKPKNQLNKTEIKVSNNFVLKIETPKIKDLLKLSSLSKKDLLRASIKQVVVNQEIYNVETFLSKEVEDFINNLPLNVMNEIEKQSQPELTLSITTNEGESEVAGVLTFFTLR